jgi:hypothetical protein
MVEMSLDWSRERYIRVFTRDTPTWNVASFEEQSFLMLLMRKLDRNGNIDMGRHGVRGIASTLKAPVELVESCLAFWTTPDPENPDDVPTLVVMGRTIHMPNFREAQECKADVSLRVAQHRERKQDETREPNSVTRCNGALRDVTGTIVAVTDGNANSDPVTPSRTVPTQAVPTQTKPEIPERTAPSASAPAVAESGVHAVAEPKSAKRKRGESEPATRCPAPDDPDAEEFCRRWVMPPPSDPRSQEFMAYWCNVRGAKGLKTRWDWTFRNRQTELIQRQIPMRTVRSRLASPVQPVVPLPARSTPDVTDEELSKAGM